MTWKKGDLGRLRNEDPSRPHFEVMSMSQDRKLIKLWYSGQYQPMAISVSTFRTEARSFWTYFPPKVAIPNWVQEGMEFDFKGMYLTTADAATYEDRRQSTLRIWTTAKHVLHGTLRIRSVRQGFASCLDGQGKLVIISLAEIAQNGILRPTIWNLLSQEDEDEDEAWI